MHILIFQNSMECYGSYAFFAKALADGFTENGHQVTSFFYDLSETDAWAHLDEERYDAIIDINSKLPKVKTEDGIYLLDCLQGPFFNYILDHPLYHHEVLRVPLKNYHVICLDEGHKAYIEKYYPHIKSVLMLPMTGVSSNAKLLSDRSCNRSKCNAAKIPVLFTGTFMAPEEWLSLIQQMPEDIRTENMQVLQYRKQHLHVSPEEAFAWLLEKEHVQGLEGNSRQEEKESLSEEMFALHLHLQFAADMYIRSYARNRVLEAIAQAGISLTVCGPGYEKATWSHLPNIHIIEETDFADTMELMEHAEIVLSLMAGFQNGCHDRVFSAMLNHAACVSERNQYTKTHFIEETHYLGFNVCKPEEAVLQIKRLLVNGDLRSQIAQNGFNLASVRETFLNRAEKIEKHILAFDRIY